MSQLSERIAQYRKMATDDPTNELAHFRLGQTLMEDGQFEEAAKSFRQTLELSPQFSKVFQLLGRCLIQLQKRSEAIELLRKGIQVADERGDNLPREEMSKMLTELGEKPPAPAVKRPVAPAAGGGGFKCSRPDCAAGANARQLPRPPMGDEIGRRIYESVCAECWDYWVRNMSVKVINELRLDLSTEQGGETYDQIMKETLGLT
jgi:tetratricopeptide (TPR) repeat protein